MSKPQQLPSGRWRIRYATSNGRRKSETFATAEAARSALRRRETAVEDVRIGRREPGGELRLRDVAADFLREWESKVARAKRQPTLENDPRRAQFRLDAHRSHIDRWILPELGDLTLAEVPARVDAFVRVLGETRTARTGEKNEAGRTLGASTIRNAITTLRQLMKYGKRPIAVEMPKELRQRQRAAGERPNYIATGEAIQAFLEACGKGWFHVAAAISIYSNARRGEIASLRWRHISFKTGKIRIESSWGGLCKGNEARTVALAPELAAILQAWRMKTGKLTDQGSDQHVILVNGAPMREESNRCAVLTRKACKRAGIDRVTFHGLRATYASHAADNGMPISQLRALMGHKKIETTAIYVRSDSEIAAEQPAAILSFRTPDAKVISMRPAGGHAVDTSSSGA